MSKRLNGKVAVVTGAGRGIGRAYAHALAAEGAKIVVNDLGAAVDGSGREESSAAAVAREIVELGGEAVPDTHSVADFDGAEQIMRTAVSTFGRLDILVANAGNIRMAQLHESSAADWRDVMAVHADGTFHCIRHAVPLMLEHGGTIITTGDLSQGFHYPQLGAYRAAKAAIMVATLTAAHELKQHGINVNSVFPGTTSTRMAEAFFDGLDDKEGFYADAKEHFQADSEAAAAEPETVPPVGVYLCTDEGRSITGRSFVMDGTGIGLCTTTSELSFIAPNTAAWTTEELIARIPEWLTTAEAAAIPVTTTQG
ncbi:SDR family NAD(P)-dependent oxidoreductase [Nocardia tengchongensis]|uniref:SDR family NAD(P)-dependent oxidoreductase n=1 Tax=Nocardia tengchongensis TaxID=2055889 RepID=UPI0036B1CA52